MSTTQQITPRWCCLSADGIACICADEDDAIQSAKLADGDWPSDAPNRAVQLVDATAFDELLTAAQATLSNNLHLADGDNCTLIDIKRAVEKITGKPV